MLLFDLGYPLDGIGRSGSSPDFHVGSGDEVVARWRHSSERHSDREVQQGEGKRLVSGVLTESRAHFRKEMDTEKVDISHVFACEAFLHIPPIEKESVSPHSTSGLLPVWPTFFSVFHPVEH